MIGISDMEVWYACFIAVF